MNFYLFVVKLCIYHVHFDIIYLHIVTAVFLKYFLQINASV